VASTHDGTDPVRAARAFSGERGVDGVLITASAKSDEIVHQAARMCRKRGRIVLVGVVGLNLLRSDFYEKELSFQVACSYGPGRYDPRYEAEGRDYPLPYVRWTVARNFEAVLDAMARGLVDVRPLISQRIAHADAARAYEAILKDSQTLGVVLTYPRGAAPSAPLIRLGPAETAAASPPATPCVGVIGAGNFAKMVLLPAIKATGAVIKSVASASGVTGVHAARKSGALEATTDYHEILHAPDINTVFIVTPHATHPRLVAEALAAGKHVFVEKPLAIDETGLDEVRRAVEAHPHLQLMVGFNRRFAPHAVKARELLAGRSQPVSIALMVNAGEIPSDHWTRDPAVGGGRIVGEACHFIDLALFLVGHPIVAVQAVALGQTAVASPDDSMSVDLSFADGSMATINYWTNGPKSYPKERVEIFSEGRVLVIDNWRGLRAYDWRGVPRMRMRQDKGHRAEIAAFIARVAAGGEPLIPFAELEMATAASFAAVRSARESVTIPLSTGEPVLSLSSA
jgi:predicted dehydrogenase